MAARHRDSGPAGELPDGVVREAAPPERLVVVWAARPLDGLWEALDASGHLPVRLPPAETVEMVRLSGPAAMVLVDADVLDDAALAAIEDLRATYRETRVCVLATAGSSADGLLRALRAGLSTVVDPADPEQVTRLLAPPGRADGERVLAVGAHPDDVEIGCGATLLRHRAMGHPVTVLTLSRGARGGEREVRRREAVAAAVALSAELLMGDLPDTRMEEAHEMVSVVEGVIAQVEPTTVYVHSAADNHQDHRAVHDATVIAARRVARLFCYQSPSSRNGFAPTKFVTVDDTVEEKVRVLAAYRSQSTRHYLEPDLVVATARYWARQLAAARYAEPFEVLRSSGEYSL